MARWTRTLGAVVISALAFAATPAFAGTEDDLRDRLEAANAAVANFETHEMADEAALEMGQARLEIAEVQGKISAADYGWATIVLNRLEARVELIESIMERATVEQLADQRETDLFDMTNEADEAQLELETVQQRRQQLQDDVAVIVDQMNAEK